MTGREVFGGEPGGRSRDGVTGLGALGCPLERLEAVLVDPTDEVGRVLAHHAPVDHHVDAVDIEVLQDARVVGDDDERALARLAVELQSSMPRETTLSASTSRPESVSSRMASLGWSSSSWSISTFFFSPPEKPTPSSRLR